MTSRNEEEGAIPTTLPRVTPWHVTLFLQIFLLIDQILIATWYAIVMVSPGSVSEYLPPEVPATVSTVLGSLSPSIIWGLLIYFTWKGKKSALLASFATSIILLVGILLIFLTKTLAPDFSDFLSLTILTLLAIFSAKAYRSFPKKAP